MRSVIKLANAAGVEAVVDQQFEVGRQILAAGLVPIIEPEVDIHSPEKARGRGAAQGRRSWPSSDALADDQHVMLKLTLPDADGFYSELVDAPARAARRRPVRRLQPRRTPTPGWRATTASSPASPAP